jgi:hypothetical protein
MVTTQQSSKAGPLRRIGLEAAAVGRKIGKSEFADSPVQTLADLAAHLTKSGPAEIALRERPLEETSAISIVHGTANQPYSNCLADRSLAANTPSLPPTAKTYQRYQQ